MKLGGQLEPEIESIMDDGRQVWPTPDVVRARLLARARAAVAASRATPVPLPSAPATWRGRRVAVAAAALLLFGTAGAAAALYSRATRAPEIPSTARAPEVPAGRTSVPSPRLPEPEAAPSTRPSHAHRAIAPRESYAAELQLLQRAQSEYASHDFANALVLVAEHGRRFPNGRLAEEREALRVRSLSRAGRSDEARRALAAFVKRFPHSAFLSRLQDAARSADD